MTSWRNNFDHVSDDAFKYLIGDHEVTISLTGAEIEAVFSSYFGARHVNPEKTRLKILDAFEAKRVKVTT